MTIASDTFHFTARAIVHRVSRVYGMFLNRCGDFAGIIIGFMAISITIDVVGRNLGFHGPLWLLDIEEYALYVSTFVGAPWALRAGAHVRIDMLLTVIPAAWARGIEVVADGLGVMVCATLGYFGVVGTYEAYRTNEIMAKVLAFPQWYVLWIAPACLALLGIEFALRIGRVWRASESPWTTAQLD